MAASLNELLEKRRITRGRFTKYITVTDTAAREAETLVADDESNEKDVHIAIRTALSSFKRVEEVYGELSGVQDQIDYHADNDARLKAVKDDDGEVRYLKAYNHMCASIQGLEACLSPVKEASEASGKSAKSEFSPEMFAESLSKALAGVNTGVSETQLEEILSTLTHKKRVIQIPKFKGDTELFDQWRDLVDAEVRKPGYSDVEKTHVVISLLDGEVAKLVSGLKDPSYEEIIEFLENRYGDVLARIEKAVNEIASVPVVKSPTVRELDPVLNTLVANWNYIKKRTHDDPELIRSSWILTALVRRKMPKSLVRKWDSERIKEEKRTTAPSNLPIRIDDLIEKIQDAVKVARRSESLPNDPKKERSFERRPSGHALNVTPQTQESTESRCVFCDNAHQSYSCPSVSKMRVEERCERVKAARACFNCLSRFHMVKTCRSRGCKSCKKNHHTLLHFEKRSGSDNAARSNVSGSSNLTSKVLHQNKVESTAGLVKSTGSTNVVMQSGIVKLESKSRVAEGRVLLDTGSGVTFISRSMAKRLNLRGPKVEGEFILAGGEVMATTTEKVKFYLSGILPGWKGEVFEISAYILDKPSAPINAVNVDFTKMSHLRGLQLAERFPVQANSEVDVLLGIEDTLNILKEKRIRGPPGTPMAQKTHIGWILCGPYSTQTEVNRTYCVHRVSFQERNETEMATRYWDLEHLGIRPNESKNSTELETSALEQHRMMTTRVGDHYVTGLPRHPSYKDRILKSNRALATNRLIGLEKRLKRDPRLASEYEAQIQDLLSAGRAEKVLEDREPDNHQVWYLPHHPVVRRDKTTTKVRVVFDGSMIGYEGVSLNETLLPGPALQPDLPGVLLRFRRHRVALVADIEKMFLQVKMRKEDQDSQRFLWRGLDKSKEPEVYRLTTVTFGLTSSPFSSIQTILDHVKTKKESYPKAVAEIEDNIFVDDVLTGEELVEDAATLTTDLKTVLYDGGFSLRKFISNKPEALSHLEKRDLASFHKVATFAEESTKTLGVKYSPREDVLMFSFLERMDDRPVETRRSVLQQLHRVYDPLGMLSPFTIKAKQIFQRTWLTQGTWDDPLPEELDHEWRAWKEQVEILDEIKVPRCLKPEDFQNPIYSLHGFGDACEASYGSAIYLLAEDRPSGRKYSTLLFSKTRLSPIGKRRSIPELELIAALINARLVTYVRNELKLLIEKTICWTDSQVVLQWISKPAYTWQVFVANRVSEIQQLVRPLNWRYVPGKLNPADLCSRGVTARAVVDSALWWDGPLFLRQKETEWPPIIVVSNEAEKANEKKKTTSTSLAVLPSQRLKDSEVEQYVEKFSDYEKFIRVMMRLRSWITLYRRDKANKDVDTVPDEGSDRLSERRKEELHWIQWAQEKHFQKEIQKLKAGESVEKTSVIVQLNPYWDKRSQVIRVGGRLNYAPLPEEVKHPIVLPTHNSFVKMLVMHYHKITLHPGAAQTLASLRNRYWIVHGKQEVRRILNTCKTCREPLKIDQRMAPLPEERISIAPAFTNVGVDFAGPLFVRVTVGGESTSKVYICLFSCMVTRAIHLELVETLTTEQFMLALRRMMSRRGRCRMMLSDNAKTFKKASDIVQKIFKKQDDVRDKLEQEGIRWKFITERAPWHGGFYERMVGSVKRPLKKVLGKSKLTLIELMTVLTEVEAMVNSRPLTMVSSDTEDWLPLTPGHLAIGRSPSLFRRLTRLQHRPHLASVGGTNSLL
ncbi:uncharacterized protein LOC135500981 [Lineus longissimus]|uniref:uncharacterized protein LOC135500981 n=1 Tax=Lineus longissimus TaxID=88925 RepID=UPI00315C5375